MFSFSYSPPQPSAPHGPLPPAPVGGGVANKDPTQPPTKEKLTTAEVASNIIISNPNLTGKHIAAMTNTTQPSCCSASMLPHSVYSSSMSQSAGSSGELVSGPPLVSIPFGTQQLVDTGWGSYSPQHNNHMYHNALSSPPVSMTAGGLAQDFQPNGGGGGGGVKPHLESTVVPLASGGGGGGGMQGEVSSPSQANSSPRPRILRGKRSIDG